MVRRAITPGGGLLAVVYTADFNGEPTATPERREGGPQNPRAVNGRHRKTRAFGGSRVAAADRLFDCDETRNRACPWVRPFQPAPQRQWSHRRRGLVAWIAPELAFTFALTALLLLGFLLGRRQLLSAAIRKTGRRICNGD